MNLVQCVEKYGDKTFSEVPLTEVDSLTLSALAYLDFWGLVEERGFSQSLRELKDESVRLCAGSVHPREEIRLLDAVCKSRRYSSLKIGYFREIDDARLPMRFAAVSFRFEDGSVYVAFRGTDVTLDAWHEDLDLLFQNTIPSQEEAKKFLSDVMSAEQGAVYVGGHSKGGNLAVYASSMIEERFQERIKAVYDHDGPGFYEDFFMTAEYLRIMERVQKTVPHDSLVGMMLRHTECYRVVKSRKKLLGQHNAFMWEIDSLMSFHTLQRIASISKGAEAALKDWIDGMSLVVRREFVNALFLVIGASGATTVGELKKRPLRTYAKMWRAYRALPQEQRLLVKRGGGVFLRILFRIVRRHRGMKRSEKAVNKHLRP